MSALFVAAAFGGILGLYSLIEDIVWAARATRPMARRLSKRELRKLYRKQMLS